MLTQGFLLAVSSENGIFVREKLLRVRLLNVPGRVANNGIKTNLLRLRATENFWKFKFPMKETLFGGYFCSEFIKRFGMVIPTLGSWQYISGRTLVGNRPKPNCAPLQYGNS